MNRQQVIEKIKSMLKLQESTDFDGEAQNAARLIDKLCKEYNISIEDAHRPEILTEVFEKFRKISYANHMLFTSICYFYDAIPLISTVKNTSRTFKIMGSESQIIQARLYYDYLLEVMERESAKALQAEKILAQLTGSKPPSKAFGPNFRKAFAIRVSERLSEIKEHAHEHAKYTEEKFKESGIKTQKHKDTEIGVGGYEGSVIGSDVSLNKQTTGETATHKFICASSF
jgi:hypothetical protein